MKRTLALTAALGLLLGTLACSGNDQRDTEAAVFLQAEVNEYSPDINISIETDVTIKDLTITSHPKNPTAVLNAGQDVSLHRWVFTPYRTDGGVTASPTWTHDLLVFVSAGGSASLENYRVMPGEHFGELPLANLLPENGGFDPETGNQNIRQSIKVEIYGETASGKAVKVEFEAAFNFFHAG